MLEQGCLDKVRKIHALFLAGAIPGPEQHELHPSLAPGSRENYLYFTLACSLNFQRSSPALWRSAMDTYRDSETRYVFFPECVVRTTHEALQRDLLKYRLALQTNRHPTAWRRICTSLAEHYDSDPRLLLQEGNYDIPQIIHSLQLEKKHLFPYLSGAKLSNYWLFILSDFTDADAWPSPEGGGANGGGGRDRCSEWARISPTHVRTSSPLHYQTIFIINQQTL
jgi:hypothetical protein